MADTEKRDIEHLVCSISTRLDLARAAIQYVIDHEKDSEVLHGVRQVLGTADEEAWSIAERTGQMGRHHGHA
jgi:hypothetical protein